VRIGELKKQREKEVIRNKESYSQAGSSLKSPRVKESRSQRVQVSGTTPGYYGYQGYLPATNGSHV